MFGLNSAAEKARLSAIDMITSKIMIADAKLNITYMNSATRELLAEAESDLKKELPGFNVSTLIGSNIDIFHKNPSHQRNMLAALKTQHRATIFVGQRAFDLIVTPLRDGNRISGFVVEWADANVRLMNLDYHGQIEAIGRVQAVIEFSLTGEILTANQNFCDVLGYRLEEIAGRHHSMFVDKAYASSPEYQQFWEQLRSGRFQAAEFVRHGKGGKRVVINASYNPIFDEKGRVAKVVKFATDVTTRVENVDQLAGALKALAEGDLTRTLDAPFLPSLETLRVDFNEASSKLRLALQQISQNAGAIAAASQEIQSATSDLSKRTETQAASIEETAAALEEITTTVSDSSHRAQEAGQLVRKTKNSAELSGKVVGQAVEAMGKIEQSAGEIGNIIGVIDEIAFQTNLLALNAGVEAARAGEAGKGFAVVAQEVRELAQRSAKAAKEIKELINTSNEHVKSGVALVGDTGKALQDIVVQVVQVDGNVGAIVEASREQATGLREINTAVNTMDQGTQQNAAMVEETTAAAHGLAREAEQLFDLLSQFNIGAEARQTRPARTTAPRQPAPVASPARQAVAKVAHAFNGNAALKGGESWEEF